MADERNVDPRPDDAPEGNDDGVSRREAIRRIAAAAGVAWTVPVIQTIDAQKAYAFSPGLTTFSVRLNPNGGCHDASGGRWHSFRCMRTSANLSTDPGGCALIAGLDKADDGRWFVSLAQGVVFIEGWSRSGAICLPSPTESGSSGPVEFVPGESSPPPKQINEVQLTIGQEAS